MEMTKLRLYTVDYTHYYLDHTLIIILYYYYYTHYYLDYTLRLYTVEKQCVCVCVCVCVCIVYI